MLVIKSQAILHKRTYIKPSVLGQEITLFLHQNKLFIDKYRNLSKRLIYTLFHEKTKQ